MEDNFVAQCKLGCWAVGAAAGAGAIYFLTAEAGFLVALLVAVALAVFLALVMQQLFCWPEDEEKVAIRNRVATGNPAAPVPSPPKPTPPGYGTPAAGGNPVGGPTGQAVIAERAHGAAEADAAPATSASEAASKIGAMMGSGDAATEAAEATPDYDKDGVHEGTGEGSKPAGLDGPRGGTADNLKEIKGVGPKLESLLHSMGFYHFDQIANWTADEVAWVDANLEGFKGRVSRDNWIDQAKILASGGETEFSKRVDEGDVY